MEAQFGSGDIRFMALYAAVAIWLVANIAAGFWLFSAASGWNKAKRLSYAKRLHLVLFGGGGLGVTDPQELASIRKFARRFRVYYYLVFLLPIIVFCGVLYAVYAAPGG
jgi:hypothetical protein